MLLPLALIVLAILAAFTLFPGLIAPDNPIALAMSDRLKPPSLLHLFGTDEGGRDVFSRVVFGARYSLGVAIAHRLRFGAVRRALWRLSRAWRGAASII